MIPEVQTERKPVKVDWLAERRAKRQERSAESKRFTNANWWEITHRDDFTDSQKLDVITEQAKIIEEEAMWREKKQRAQGTTFESHQEVNDLLIDAIEAKLSLLENM